MELEGNAWQKPFGGGGDCFKEYAELAKEWFCLSCSSEMLFFSWTLLEFLGKCPLFECMVRVGGGPESKALVKGSEFPAWNLTRTLDSQLGSSPPLSWVQGLRLVLFWREGRLWEEDMGKRPRAFPGSHCGRGLTAKPPTRAPRAAAVKGRARGNRRARGPAGAGR